MYLITDTLTLVELVLGLLAAFSLVTSSYNLWESDGDIRAAFRTLSLTAERTRIVAVGGLFVALLLETMSVMWLLVAAVSGNTRTLVDGVAIAAPLTALHGLFIALILQQSLVGLTLVLMRYSLRRTWARIATHAPLSPEELQEQLDLQERQELLEVKQVERQGLQDARQGLQDERQERQDERQEKQERPPQ